MWGIQNASKLNIDIRLTNLSAILSMAISGSDLFEVTTIYEAYIRPKFRGIFQQNMAWKMLQFFHFRILNFFAIYGNIYRQYTPNVSIYTSTMDPMGYLNHY